MPYPYPQIDPTTGRPAMPLGKGPGMAQQASPMRPFGMLPPGTGGPGGPLPQQPPQGIQGGGGGPRRPPPPDMPMRPPQQQVSSPMMMARIMQMAKMGLFNGQGQGGGDPMMAIGAGAGNAGGQTGGAGSNALLAYLMSQGLLGG